MSRDEFFEETLARYRESSGDYDWQWGDDDSGEFETWLMEELYWSEKMVENMLNREEMD